MVSGCCVRLTPNSTSNAFNYVLVHHGHLASLKHFFFASKQETLRDVTQSTDTHYLKV